MRKFDTKVQHLKYKVLREVARLAFEDKLLDCYTEIPKMIVKGPEATMRCCIYKERAIVGERITHGASAATRRTPTSSRSSTSPATSARSAATPSPNPAAAASRTAARTSASAAPSASTSTSSAVIDKEKCVECGACAKVCPYSAITNHKRPCENACKVKAISRDEKTLAASIDNDKCIACGACVYQCPFGAITDKSYILDVVNLIKGSAGNTNYRLYAVVAPSISSQFSYAKLGQVITGIERLGFHHVVEAALGADMVAYTEAKELTEKGFLTSSCCPAFVDYIEKSFPSLAGHISHNLSPAATISKYIKETDPGSQASCSSAPARPKRPSSRRNASGRTSTASSPSRNCRRCSTAATSIIESLPEDESGQRLLFRAHLCPQRRPDRRGAAGAHRARAGQGLRVPAPSPATASKQCRAALFKASKNVLPNNFIEGMACVGGCIGGAGCLTHGEKDKTEVDKYGQEALEKSISDSIGVYFASKDAKAKDAAGGA